jgi:SAM-dependent methyltransferase
MSYSSFAAFYDKLQEADYEKIGGYFHSRLCANGAKSGILLDLACGTGTLSRHFAGLGYDVIGADISPEMLSEAAKKPCKNLQYLCQDMTGLDLFGTIDCCVCALDSLNHLPDKAAVKQAFSRVSLFMNKGGVFVFDMNTLYKHSEILSGNTFIYDLEDIYCVWQNSYCENGKIDMMLDIFCRGDYQSPESWNRHIINLSETAYSLAEIEEMLTETGFGEIKICDWLTDEPVNSLSEKAVFTAVKI